MAMPQCREPTPNLPSIMSSGLGRYRLRNDTPYSSSSAISIPGVETQDDVVPPPLPPPRHLPFLEQPEQSNRKTREANHSYSSFTTDYGSMRFPAEEKAEFKKRDTISGNHADEGYASYTASERSRESRPAGYLHQSKLYFQTAADLHCDNMKKKLDRTLDRSPRSMGLSVLTEQVRRHPEHRGSSLAMPVQLPIHSRSALGSPARFSDTPIFSASSPRSAHVRHFPGDYRAARDGSDYDCSPVFRSQRNNSDDTTSTYGGYGFSGVEDMEIDEAISPKRLHPEESFTATGHKRRAASPPSADHSTYFVSAEAARREGAPRSSPTPRLTVVPQMSASSMSSIAISRSNSYISTMSMAPSSATTTTSLEHGLPGTMSPGTMSPTSCSSPYTTPASLNHSPRNSISGRSSVHGRALVGVSPRKITDLQRMPSTKMQRPYMCECCPKKPKKFDTEEELLVHAAEKQYTCLFCGNRFKNKNEAERHQNSLHVRRHSWSCSALSGYDRAFHDSTSCPGEADTCGYCGEEFPRSGKPTGTSTLRGGVHKHSTEQDWDDRIRHLQEVHKFRECNLSKKFYRADHFRQHLKHSHAGSSGKWTNMLENACMIEEEPSPR